MKKAGYSINDLPRYSPWPARLLGLEPWVQRQKTPAEITREYEHEKWGPLWARVRAANRPVTVDKVDEWQEKDVPPSLCSIEGHLELMSAGDSRHHYMELVADALAPHAPASALVELGAGYGRMLLGLARERPFNEMKVMAGEFTASGVHLLQRLASAQGIEITAAGCDLASDCLIDFAIPPDAIVFTSYAMHYVPKLSASFVKALSAFRPRVVFHFEPCYEHCDSRALIGLMRRRYIELNDYNTNLVTLLHDQEKLGTIRILGEKMAVFGANPLLAASVIAWAPANSPIRKGTK
jgi:hypothetical protein